MEDDKKKKGGKQSLRDYGCRLRGIIRNIMKVYSGH